ncbi:MAG: hypothetical protein PHP95_13420 [Desulfuromonadaceae bacterium]|nr:hypothetical protein [Desulfuromonadaceae bacterium]MDD2849446.1 hypothetical protein [Desulfuromonadaceae bacterium]MDD4130540.1 hypothetical protein [Desulfuromonadaceae bacterium]
MKNFLISALGLLVVIGCLCFFYFGAKFFWTTLSSINPSLAVGIIAAGSTIIVSVISVLITKLLEQKAAIKIQQREKKIPIYEELLAFLFTTWRIAIIHNELPTQKEMLDFIYVFTPKLIVWGSDEVMVAFSNLKQAKDQDDMAIAIGDLWIAIRKDLGHKNDGVSKATLLKTVISDVDHEQIKI